MSASACISNPVSFNFIRAFSKNPIPAKIQRMVSFVLVTTTLKFSPRLGSTPAIAGLRSKEAGAANNLRVTAPPALRGNDMFFRMFTIIRLLKLYLYRKN